MPRTIVSGGNDADIRLNRLDVEETTVFRHHSMKVCFILMLLLLLMMLLLLLLLFCIFISVDFI
jgi:hypothetical protein